MPVLIRAENAPRSWVRHVKKQAERMLAAMRLNERELSILLCDDPTIHELNRDYRDKDSPTDVLAFTMLEGMFGPELESNGVLGDVVISIETATRQAAEQQRSVEDEVAMLLAHGILHLLGLDHPTRAEERRMTARTDLLRAAAIPPRPRKSSRNSR